MTGMFRFRGKLQRGERLRSLGMPLLRDCQVSEYPTLLPWKGHPNALLQVAPR